MTKDLPSCALCDRPIEAGAGYAVRIDVLADPEIPPMSSEEIESADMTFTLAQLAEQMKGMSAEELQDGVHRRFVYRLCASCHRSYLANPLGMPRRSRVSAN